MTNHAPRPPARAQVLTRQWERCPLCQQRAAEEGVGGAEGLQAWFVGRAHALLAARGRRMMGWDEVRGGWFALGGGGDWCLLLMDGRKGLVVMRSEIGFTLNRRCH